MSVDEEFLRMIQRRGWQIVEVSDESCTARCRASGCGMVARLVPAAPIPQVDPGGTRNVTDIPISNYEDLIAAWMNRRQGLAISIKEAENACGLTDDHLAKILKPGSTKIPNAQTMIEICNTFGLDVVLRPADLPLITLRRIVETRGLVDSRRRRNSQDNARRRRKETST